MTRLIPRLPFAMTLSAGLSYELERGNDGGDPGC